MTSKLKLHGDLIAKLQGIHKNHVALSKKLRDMAVEIHRLRCALDIKQGKSPNLVDALFESYWTTEAVRFLGEGVPHIPSLEERCKDSFTKGMIAGLSIRVKSTKEDVA